MEDFQEHCFSQKMSEVMVQARSVLERARDPALAGDVAHQYEDKFALAETLTNAAAQAILNVLALLQVDAEKLKVMKQWAANRSVTLRLRGSETCEFVRHEQYEEESRDQHVAEVKSRVMGTTTITSKTVTTIHEYFWAFTASYELVAFAGSDVDASLSIHSRVGHYEIKTRVEQSPQAEVCPIPTQDCNILWLLSVLNPQLTPDFRIARESKSCHTPRRNREVESAGSFLLEFFNWAGNCEGYFCQRLFPVQSNSGLDLSGINGRGIFVPVLPFLEEPSRRPSPPSYITPGFNWRENVGLTPSDIAQFMEEERRGLAAKLAELGKTLPGAEGSLITQHEARFVVAMSHGRFVVEYWQDGVNYLEHLLRTQLVSAIGKVVGVAEISEYMAFHNRKIFKEAYVPAPLCFTVRRPGHSPEGVISVVRSEEADGDDLPVLALQHTLGGGSHINSFALDASTLVQCRGPRIVHALVNHTFGGSSQPQMKLSMRARQFSSFIVILGNMVSSGVLAPRSAIIITNKDEVLIPLLLETLPTPQAFRDAIESLSLEQQAFAKAFRSMQLESTLFGLMVIQIKPALERLLNLPDDSLTKEIALSQELLELFMTYQVPSDLLSFDPEMAQEGELASVEDRVAQVTRHVGAMQGMIDSCKQRQLEEARAKAELELQLRLQEEARRRQEEEDLRLQQRRESAKMFQPPVQRSGMAKRSKCAAPSAPKHAMMSSIVSNTSALAPSAPAPILCAPAPPPPGPSACSPIPCPAPSPASVAPPAEIPQVDEPVIETIPEVGLKENALEGEYELTSLPSQLDSNFDRFDADNSLHSLIIKAGPVWQKKFRKSLLSLQSTSSLGKDELKSEKERAFDLLDALTRSGALVVEQSELHVLVGASHDFAESVMDTLIQDNINPIAHLERSMAIIAHTITGQPARTLIKDEHLDRLSTQTPLLFH